jgi:hypothetical protein
VTSSRHGDLVDAIENHIGGGPYDIPHPTHGEHMSVTGGLFAVATAINRLAEAVEHLGDR